MIPSAESLHSRCAVLQVKLEELLLHADTLPLELVEGTEKAREKERRQVAREDKILQQKQEHVSLYDVALAFGSETQQLLQVAASCCKPGRSAGQLAGLQGAPVRTGSL